MCPSSGELLYQRDTWFMSFCADDHLVCRSICCSSDAASRWPGPHPGHQQAASSVLYTTSCKYSLVLLMMGEIIAQNMLSWLNLSIKLLLLHLVGCLYYYISSIASGAECVAGVSTSPTLLLLRRPLSAQSCSVFQLVSLISFKLCGIKSLFKYLSYFLQIKIFVFN